MDDLVERVDCVKVVNNDTKTEMEVYPEEVAPQASLRGEACEEETSVSKYSYLGRVLPKLIVQHQDWGIPEFYQALSSQKDFPMDGSVTKVKLRKKVLKLRKKMKSNEGFLLDPYDNTQQLRANSESCNETAENGECGETPNCSNTGEGCSLKTTLGLMEGMATLWCGCTYSGMVKTKGPVDGLASFIQEMSTYITMLRSRDGKEAARLFFSALLYDKEMVFGYMKSSVGVTNEDVELWEAIKTDNPKKAKSMLEKLVKLDEERVKNGKGEGKSLPYLQLASIYLNGRGVQHDIKRAEDLYRIAADRGNSIAQHKMAYLAEQRGVKGKRLMDMYKIGVENKNADSMNSLAVELLDQPGKTFTNNKKIRDLLKRGVQLNTSSMCKETYVRENIGIGDIEMVYHKAWELIVTGECVWAGFFAGTRYLSKRNRRLMLGDALLQLSAGKGCDIAQQWLPRVKELRMQKEGTRYRSQIPSGYVQEQREWELARDLMLDDLFSTFQKLLVRRLEECFLETSHLQDD